MPLAFAYIEVKDDGYVHGAGQTDINGNFNISIYVPPSGLTVRCYVYTQNFYTWNYKVKVVPSDSDFSYSDSTASMYSIQPGETKTINYTFHHQDEIWRNAFTVFSYHTGLNKGWYYIYNTTGSDILNATARYPVPGPQYDNDTHEIHLPGYTYSYPDTILHEYAHYVMHHVYGEWPPNATGPYEVKNVSNPFMAWTEGWAYFFPLAVKNNGTYEMFPDATIDFEAPHWCSPDWNDNDSVVGRVTGALWDIFDPNDDGYDTFTDGFTHVWNIMNTTPCYTFHQFWYAWVALNQSGTPGYPKSITLMAIFQNSIDYREPGDIDGPNDLPDYKVDYIDVYEASSRFGTKKGKPGPPEYDQRADVTGPEGIPDDKIDMRDIYYIARLFGTEYEDC